MARNRIEQATGAKAVIKGAVRLDRKSSDLLDRLNRAEKRLAELEGKMTAK